MSRGCGNLNSYSQHSVCCLQLGIVQECFDVSSCMVVEKNGGGGRGQ